MRLIFLVISAELLHIFKETLGKKKSKSSFIPTGAGRNSLHLHAWSRTTALYDGSSVYPKKITPHFPSPHTLKLLLTQNHPQRSYRTAHKSSWRMYNTSLVYWYQPAWLRWSLSEPIPLTPWMAAASRGRKTAGICILTQKFTLCRGPCWWVFLSGSRSANSYQTGLKMWKFYHVAFWAWSYSS